MSASEHRPELSAEAREGLILWAYDVQTAMVEERREERRTGRDARATGRQAADGAAAGVG